MPTFLNQLKSTGSMSAIKNTRYMQPNRSSSVDGEQQPKPPPVVMTVFPEAYNREFSEANTNVYQSTNASTATMFLTVAGLLIMFIRFYVHN